MKLECKCSAYALFVYHNQQFAPLPISCRSAVSCLSYLKAAQIALRAVHDHASGLASSSAEPIVEDPAEAVDDDDWNFSDPPCSRDLCADAI